MKIVAKCYSLQPLSFEFKDNLCNSIPLSKVLTIFDGLYTLFCF